MSRGFSNISYWWRLGITTRFRENMVQKVSYIYRYHSLVLHLPMTTRLGRVPGKWANAIFSFFSRSFPIASLGGKSPQRESAHKGTVNFGHLLLLVYPLLWYIQNMPKKGKEGLNASNFGRIAQVRLLIDGWDFPPFFSRRCYSATYECGAFAPQLLSNCAPQKDRQPTAKGEKGTESGAIYN